MTDRGLKRCDNQDHFLIADLHKSLRIHQTSLDFEDEDTLFSHSQGLLLLVADGMGGHVAGEQASRLTIESLTTSILNAMPSFFNREAVSDEAVRDELQDALHRCEERLQLEAQSNPSLQGMGTTLTTACIQWPRATLFHAGDSRCYLFRDGDLTQLTRDHTLAQQVAEGKVAPPEGTAPHRLTNMLWNAIGSQGGTVQPDIQQVRLKLNDTLLLCTDGLTRHLSDQIIAGILTTTSSALSACEALITQTLNYGAADNVTAVVVRFIDNATQQQLEETASVEIKRSEVSLQDTVSEVSIVTGMPEESINEDDLEPSALPSSDN